MKRMVNKIEAVMTGVSKGDCQIRGGRIPKVKNRYALHFVSLDLCTLRTLSTRCGPVLLHALRTCLFTDTHSYMPDDIVGRAL